MKFIETIELSEPQKQAVYELWNNEYPEKLRYHHFADFENYLDALVQTSHILLMDNDGNIKGWYFDFVRESEKWFAIILDSSSHGKGLGTSLLNTAKEKESQLSGWVIDHNNDKKQNGAYYKSPLNFYLKNGFNVLPNVRLELEKLSAVKIKWVE